MVKIGKTTRASEVRAAEISQVTGVPGQFEVLYEEDVADVTLAERLIHERLAQYRVNPRREFFLLPLKYAVRTVFSVCMSIDDINLGKCEPRLFIYLKTEETSKFSRMVKEVLKRHVGGNARVFLEMKTEKAQVVVELGSAWRLKFSPVLVKDLGGLRSIAEWDWFAEPRGEKFEDIPF